MTSEATSIHTALGPEQLRRSSRRTLAISVLPDDRAFIVSGVIAEHTSPKSRFRDSGQLEKESGTMSDSTKSIYKPVILPHQKPIFDRLCTIARACLYVDRKSITALIHHHIKQVRAASLPAIVANIEEPGFRSKSGVPEEHKSPC
jgi:hypothetical protein